MNPDRVRAPIAIVLSILVHASIVMLGNIQIGKAGMAASPLAVTVVGYTNHETPQSLQETQTESVPRPENISQPEPVTELAPVQEPTKEPAIVKPVNKPRRKVEEATKSGARMAVPTPVPLKSKPTPSTASRPSSEKNVPSRQQTVKSPNTEIEVTNRLSDSQTGSAGEETSRGLVATFKPDVTAIPLYYLIPKPPYPDRSRDLGEAGTVIVAILVAKDGSVAEAYISQSSGFPLLDGSALSTVKAKWRFKPATKRGEPVSSWVRAPINFNIK